MSIIKWENELSNNQGILYSKDHLLKTLRTIYESIGDKDKPDHEKLCNIQNILNDSMHLSFQQPQTIWNGAFKHVRFIKQGGFGEVFKGIDIIDNCMYAIKKITIRMDPENTIPYARLLHKIREVRCLSVLDHPNIIRYYHSWVEMDNTNMTHDLEEFEHYENNNSNLSSNSNKLTSMSKSQSYDSFLSQTDDFDKASHSNTQLSLYIKMEYMQYTLSKLLEKNTLNISQRMNIIFSMISAIYYLHHLEVPIIHRDIKPDNILISIDNDQISKIKLVDFGLFVYKNKIDPIQISLDGTSTYMPPDPYPLDTTYDIYSLGIVIFECMHTFDTQMEKYIKIQELKCQKLSTGIELIDRMVSPISNERPSIQELLTHWNHSNLRKNIIDCIQI